jgi:hypothetical protein
MKEFCALFIEIRKNEWGAVMEDRGGEGYSFRVSKKKRMGSITGKISCDE